MPLKLYWLGAVYYQISLEEYQIICVRSFSFAKGQQAFENINQSRVNIQSRSPPKKSICWYGTQKLPKTFLATKHEKAITACSYLNFYKYILYFELLASNTIKNENIHLNSWHHSHKKQKNSLETQVVLLIFLLELKISGVAVQRIHQNSKKW